MNEFFDWSKILWDTLVLKTPVMIFWNQIFIRVLSNKVPLSNASSSRLQIYSWVGLYFFYPTLYNPIHNDT
jgi:hypothetical protein